MEKHSKDLFENITISVVYGSLLIKSMPLFIFLCVIFSAWKLWENHSEISIKFKWTWKLFVSSALALFIAKIFSIHQRTEHFVRIGRPLYKDHDHRPLFKKYFRQPPDCFLCNL